MAISAGALAVFGGIALAAIAWRFGGWTQRVLFVWAHFIRGIPLLFVIFWLYFLIPALFNVNLPGPMTVIFALAWPPRTRRIRGLLPGERRKP